MKRLQALAALALAATAASATPPVAPGMEVTMTPGNPPTHVVRTPGAPEASRFVIPQGTQHIEGVAHTVWRDVASGALFRTREVVPEGSWSPLARSVVVDPTGLPPVRLPEAAGPPVAVAAGEGVPVVVLHDPSRWEVRDRRLQAARVPLRARLHPRLGRLSTRDFARLRHALDVRSLIPIAAGAATRYLLPEEARPLRFCPLGAGGAFVDLDVPCERLEGPDGAPELQALALGSLSRAQLEQVVAGAGDAGDVAARVQALRLEATRALRREGAAGGG